MASSKPISLPGNPGESPDVDMSSASYSSAANGSFNPASYTRHFMGSPISWKAGSVGFGGRVFTGGSPIDFIMGSLEARGLVGPIDTEKGARFLFEREDELCRNYMCCNIHLTDLHALVEHFEEVHVVVMEQPSASGPQQTRNILPFNPQPFPANPPSAHSHTTPRSQAPQAQPAQETYAVPVDPDDMELDMGDTQGPSSHSSPSSGGPTPPDTPISTPLSLNASPMLYGNKPLLPTLQQIGQGPSQPHSPYSPYQSPYTSQPPSPHAYSPGFDGGLLRRSSTHNPSSLSAVTTADTDSRPNLNLDMGAFSRPPSTGPPSAMEPLLPYSKYASDYSSLTGALDPDAVTRRTSPKLDPQEGCLPPALLFSNAGTPEASPEQSRVSSPTQATPPAVVVPPTSAATVVSKPSVTATVPSPSAVAGSSRAPTVLARSGGATSLMLSSSKPFKCPKPGCNKSYKQANGLKYHTTHGSCNFAPSKDLEHIHTILEKKRRDRADADGVAFEADDRIPGSGYNTPLGPGFPDLGQITETELREVEREAERRLKPFACGIGDCQRRYKNMNGLRYHYQHSGEHGVVGLGLLASGVHECLGQGGAANRDGNSLRDRSREGRKSRTGSKPNSRAPSVSRTSTPITPVSTFQIQHIQSALSKVSDSPTQRLSPTTAFPELQAHAQLVYQQFTNQHAQQRQQSGLTVDAQHQQQQLQQMQAQFAAMQSRMYNNSSMTTST